MRRNPNPSTRAATSEGTGRERGQVVRGGRRGAGVNSGWGRKTTATWRAREPSDRGRAAAGVGSGGGWEYGAGAGGGPQKCF